MRDVDVPPLSEVHEVEAENHDRQQHAKRGEDVGSGGFDVETRDKLGEDGIYRPILCCKVIRFCREREVLGVDLSSIVQKAVRILENSL